MDTREVELVREGMISAGEYSQALIEQLRLAGNTLFGRGRDRLKEAVNTSKATEGILTGVEFGMMQNLYVQQLLYADPYYWSIKLCNFLEQTAPNIPDWTLVTSNLPSDRGFMWFAKPLSLPKTPNCISSDEKAYPLAALSWVTIPHRVKPGLKNIEWEFRKGADYEEADALWLIISWYLWNGSSAEPVSQMSMKDGESLSYFEEAKIKPNTDSAEFQSWDLCCLKYMAAAFSFLEQRIFVTERERPDRTTRRHLPPFARPEPRIQVVLLRKRQMRTPAVAGPKEEVDWSCQWLVRGHWRQQWYTRTAIHKPKWIMPYIKGPEDKPLKTPSQTIFAVVR